MNADDIEHVRRFHRLVTQRAGVLEDHFLGRDRPLGESRVLFELGANGATLRDLRARLGLDSGYLSRIMQSLERAGLVTLAADPGDERMRRARLTRAGNAEVREMNKRSDGVAAAILEPLSDSHRAWLVAAMREVHRLLRASGAVIERADPASPLARWCVSQYFADSISASRKVDPGSASPPMTTSYDRRAGVFLIAMVDGHAAACGALKVIGPRIESLKRRSPRTCAGWASDDACLTPSNAKPARCVWPPSAWRPTGPSPRPFSCIGAPDTTRSQRSTTTHTPTTGSRSDSRPVEGRRRP
ncbi:MAG: MarR family winged helix-turn-helix transcriptional regulator [Gemmatimonadaceae bacterium]